MKAALQQPHAVTCLPLWLKLKQLMVDSSCGLISARQDAGESIFG
jgi:hypothetical protein